MEKSTREHGNSQRRTSTRGGPAAKGLLYSAAELCVVDRDPLPHPTGSYRRYRGPYACLQRASTLGTALQRRSVLTLLSL